MPVNLTCGIWLSRKLVTAIVEYIDFVFKSSPEDFSRLFTDAMPIPTAVEARVRKDICAGRKEYLFGFPNGVNKILGLVLRDPRDVPVILLLINLLILVCPCIYLVASTRSHLLGGVYLIVNNICFLQRYLVALLHVSEHKPIFNEGQIQWLWSCNLSFARLLCSGLDMDVLSNAASLTQGSEMDTDSPASMFFSLAPDNA